MLARNWVGSLLLSSSLLVFVESCSKTATEHPLLPPLTSASGIGFAMGNTGPGFASLDGGLEGSAVPAVPIHSDVPPAPINGGNLLVAHDGVTAVATDPDRDRISIVDLAGRQVLSTIQLDAGEEPGRLVEDAARRVHVVLRRKGQLATLALDGAKLLERRSVCPVPQGITYDPAKDSIYVACTSGELVTLPASGGAATRSVHVDIDLRDVLVSGDRLFVTRFKSAEVLELDANGALISRSRPSEIQGPFTSVVGISSDAGTKNFEPAVAWRTLLGPNGSLMMLHQRAQSTPIKLGDAASMAPSEGPDAGTPSACPPMAKCPLSPPPPGGQPGENPYGAANNVGCDSILHSTVSKFDDSGPQNGPPLGAVTLAVDAAMSPDGTKVALAIAGTFDDPPTKPFATPLSAVVMSLDQTFASDASAHCVLAGFESGTGAISQGQVIAVAFDPQGRLVMQSRDPNRIVVWTPTGSFNTPADFDIDLGGEPRRDTGHDLFHANAGVGLACASCHPGGGDDGRTWNFQEQGPRRTQLFNMGIRDTLPLHWDGELPTFDSLITEVFERRMGGIKLPTEHIQAVSDWMNTLRPNTPMRPKSDPAALRGSALFNSAEVGCSGCHNGSKLTDNHSVDVGTGGTFQVPSLIGVAYHQPYIHDGCATTLRERFDPACGGATHGKYQSLNEGDLADLVAYLESL